MRVPLRWIALLVVVAGVIAGASWWPGARRALTFAGRKTPGVPAALDASGTVEGTLVRVASKLQGRVARVRVREGDRVQAGQVLVELEEREINAQADQARAQLATASARYAEAVAGTRPESIRQAEAELRRAVASRDGAAAAVANLTRQLQRSTELKQNLEAAQSQVAAALATLQAAQARLDRLKAGARPDEVREVEEAVSASQATAQRAAEEEDRMRRSFERGAVARREWDLARTERDVAAANLARSRARLADLKAGARPEELREAEQQVAAARATYAGARASLANARQLYADRLPARQRLDSARAELQVATSALAAARAHLDLLRHGTRPEERQQLRSRVEEARATLTLAETRQRDRLIRAPVTGVLTARSVEPGEVVTAGARLLEIADPQTTWVRLYLPEKEYGRVRAGIRVTVTTDSLPGQTFTGRVAAIAQEAEYTPRDVQTKEERVNLMYAVKVDVDNLRGALLIGMPVDVHFR